MGVENLVERETVKVEYEPAQQEPKFAIAMVAMLGPKTFYLPFMHVGTYRKIAENAGAKLDFWPIRPLPSFQVSRNKLSPEDKSAIVSASGSFRSERSLREAWRHPNKALALPGYFLFPHRDNFNTVDRVTRQVRRHDGRRLPVVQYRETPREIRDEILTPRLVQPVPEEFIKHNIRTSEDLDKYLLNSGFDGFCFDTLHSRFLFTDLKFRHLFDEVIKRTKLVHLSLGRTDVTRPDYPTDNQRDLHDVIAQPWNVFTPIAKLLHAVRDKGFQGIYVLEIPVDSLAPHREINTILLPSEVSFLYDHARLSIANILSK